MSKKTINRKSSRHIPPLSSIIIVVLCVIIAVLLWTIITQYKTQQAKDLQTLRNLITSAAYQNVTPATANNNNQTIIPVAGLVVPYRPSLLLGYNDQNTVHLSDELAFSSAAQKLDSASTEKLFEGVPLLQACARQVIITVDGSDQDPEYTLKTTKIMRDGRKAKIYQSTVCTKNIDTVTSIAEQVNSN